tara:strand:- start:29 stop:544 length:516 start_codon:yes stop_codon:yes gene_type:complete
MIQQYNNELPEKNSFNDMSLDAAEAIAEILEMAAYIDARLSPQELETLKEELLLLSVQSTPEVLAYSSERGFFERESVGTRYDNDAIEHKLKGATKRISSDIEKQACVRLLAVLCCSDGLDTEEIDFFNLVVESLDYDYDSAQDILRAAFESYQEMTATLHEEGAPRQRLF